MNPPTKKGDRGEHLVHGASMTYEGPLPPASEFDRYEQVCPGAADRILSMAEREEAHRHDTEDRIVDSIIRQSKLGQIFAFSIALGSLGTVIFSLVIDKPFGAVAPAILALTSLSAVFIGSKKK